MPITLNEHVYYTRNEWQTEYYQNCIKYIQSKNDCSSFTDLGGCVGEVTTIMKEQLERLKDFYIVEPIRENFEYIIKRFNRDIDATVGKDYYHLEIENKNIHIYNKAIYYGLEEITLGQLSSYTNVGGWSFSDKHNINTVSSIKTMCLEEIPKSDIIKIDIEGMEVNLFEHSDFVREYKYIFLELHDDLIQKSEDILKNYLPDHKLVYKSNEQFFLKK